MPPAADPFAGTLPGIILMVLCLAVPLAFLASIASLALYRRAVVRGMRARPGPRESAPDEPVSSTAEPPPFPLQIETLDAASPAPISTSAGGLYTELLRGPWRAAAIYALAGACYALATTIIFLTATETGFGLLSFLFIFWYYAWPVVITVALVAAATRRTRLAVFGAYFVTIFVLGVIAVAGGFLANWMDVVVLWFATNFPASIILLVFLNRRIQAVGPLTLTFMLFASAGLVFTSIQFFRTPWLWEPVIKIGVALGVGAWIFLGLLLLGFALAGAIGWLVIQAIGNRYRARKVSELSITLDAIWLLFALFQSVDLIFAGPRWFVASLLSFLIYKIVARTGFALTRSAVPAGHRHPSLLVLRVFALGKRSERLFDALAVHWRFSGGIRLIAGPDLALSTMEPHEFLEFLSGRLARRFIDSEQTLERRIAETDSRPDYDGQFRVTDFFCYDDTWRMVLARLVRESDAVIMDLRGFSPGNAGVIFEIHELIDRMPLERTAFLVDGKTDEPALRQVLQEAWRQAGPSSPNRLTAAAALHLLRLESLGERELQRLLAVLARAASPAPEAALLRSPLTDSGTA